MGILTVVSSKMPGFLTSTSIQRVSMDTLTQLKSVNSTVSQHKAPKNLK